MSPGINGAILERLIESFSVTRNIKASAEAVGVGYHRARRALIRAGVLDVHRTLTPEQRADIIEGYQKLGSVKVVAHQVGVSRWAAARALHRAGVEVVPGGGGGGSPRLDCPDLGLVPDPVLAKREGVSRQAIRQRRLRRGIPAYEGGE